MAQRFLKEPLSLGMEDDAILKEGCGRNYRDNKKENDEKRSPDTVREFVHEGLQLLFRDDAQLGLPLKSLPVLGVQRQCSLKIFACALIVATLQ